MVNRLHSYSALQCCLTSTRLHNDGGVSHAGGQPARREQLGGIELATLRLDIVPGSGLPLTPGGVLQVAKVERADHAEADLLVPGLAVLRPQLPGRQEDPGAAAGQRLRLPQGQQRHHLGGRAVQRQDLRGTNMTLEGR